MSTTFGVVSRHTLTEKPGMLKSFSLSLFLSAAWVLVAQAKVESNPYPEDDHETPIMPATNDISYHICSSHGAGSKHLENKVQEM